MKNPRRFYRSMSKQELSVRQGGLQNLIRSGAICPKAGNRKIKMIQEVIAEK